MPCSRQKLQKKVLSIGSPTGDNIKRFSVISQGHRSKAAELQFLVHIKVRKNLRQKTNIESFPITGEEQ